MTENALLPLSFPAVGHKKITAGLTADDANGKGMMVRGPNS
ncbi:hypothetical protein [Mesorhizobium sp. M0340]